MNPGRLEAWLARRPPAVAELVQALAAAAVAVGRALARGDGSAAERLVVESLTACPQAAGWSSAAQAEVTPSPEHACRGGFLVAFDALERGGAAAGMLFSVLPHLFRGAPASAVAFMQPPYRQVCAGCVVYGPATRLALASAEGVSIFRLEPQRGWRVEREPVRVAAASSEFAADTARQRHWEKPVQRYVAECQAGEGGPRGRDFTMHWHGSLSAEIHHVLEQGGVALLPRQPRAAGEGPRTIELLHHAAPLALLMERAGAAASTGTTPLMEIVPDALHQRVPAIFGACDEVQRIVGYHADPQENVSWQLFKTRSLFVQPNA
ncbi:MAG TPA: class 1 fructose-bisphosphatase [Methylibium sp.]|nr:class 1 fructose-bisphosphatase [Methylibium sp.]